MSIENIVESICKIFVEHLANELPEIKHVLQLHDVVADTISLTVTESCRVFDEYVNSLDSPVHGNED